MKTCPYSNIFRGMNEQVSDASLVVLRILAYGYWRASKILTFCSLQVGRAGRSSP